MLHCNDIDGLMIDWLYGELDDAASLEVSGHVDACGRCQAEQAAFARTRDLFRELPAEEPATSLTAMLIREAALSAAPVASAAAPAPETTGGLGAWVSRLFRPLMHPAFAAVATLVLVVGVAGTLYLQKDGDDQFAESSVSNGAHDAPAEMSLDGAEEKPAAKAASAPAVAALPPAPADDMAGESDPGDGLAATTRTADLLDQSRENALKSELQRATPKKKRPARTQIAKGQGQSVAGGLRGGATKNDRGARNRKPASRRFDAKSKERVKQEKVRDGESEADEDSFASINDKVTPDSAAFRGGRPGSDSWAQSLEGKLTGAFKRSDCREAARLANDIRERNPSYYKKNTSDLAAVKKCRYYVNSERKRRTAQARKAAKAKAAKANASKTGPKNAAPAEQADSNSDSDSDAVEVE